MTFQAHGNFILRSRAHVLRVDAWGPWNLECAVDYSHRMVEAMRAMPAPFAILAVSHIQPILSPDSEEVLRQNVRDRITLGCKAMATVLLEKSGSFIARRQYERIYGAENIVHGVFAIVADGQRWLEQCGFPDAQLVWNDDAVEAALRRQGRPISTSPYDASR